MNEILREFRGFLSSPSDVAEERNAVESAVSRANKSLDWLRVAITLRRWEDIPSLTRETPDERVQELLNREVEQAKFIVLILYKRYGTEEPGQTRSNTEREVDTALARFERDPSIKFLAYFRNLSSNADAGMQEQKVRALRQRLERHGQILVRPYSTVEDFRPLIAHDLYEALLRWHLGSFKQTALRRFWRLGSGEDDAPGRLALIYPAVERDAMSASRTRVWMHRLAPHVYYEDQRALSLLERSLAAAGVGTNYSTFSTDDLPVDVEEFNRVWICVPRVQGGLARLLKYKCNATFDLPAKGSRRPRRIVWRGGAGQEVLVSSPLATYLREQRRTSRTNGPWKREFGAIVGRDYAVLARYRNRHGPQPGVYDYFLGGIRGLGTWGAAWFINKAYANFLRIQGDSDFALLLEVTYRDNAIYSVRDVSEEPQSYFVEQTRVTTIRRQIRTLRE